jgi:site-specific DNA-methyltransferase (adenine-specific)
MTAMTTSPALFPLKMWEDLSEAERREELGQFMTPGWVAHEIIAERFGDLTGADLVLEPSCGTGAFLHAMNTVHPNVQTVGVEIDPVLAEQARRETGRRVLTGDFTEIEIDVQPTAIIGNPPYSAATISAFIQRAQQMLPLGGRCGLLMPVHSLSFAQQTHDVTKGFHVRQELVPRNVFPRIHFPLMFAMFTKERQRKLFGFFLFDESLAMNNLRGDYRALAERADRQTWRSIVEESLKECGGTASIARLYDIVERRRPRTTNRFVRDKVRQTLHLYYKRVDVGVYALA